MKYIFSTILLLIGVLFSSCEKDNNDKLDADDISGTYTFSILSKATYVNGNYTEEYTETNLTPDSSTLYIFNSNNTGERINPKLYKDKDFNWVYEKNKKKVELFFPNNKQEGSITYRSLPSVHIHVFSYNDTVQINDSTQHILTYKFRKDAAR
jgi:hypothetical protein